MKVKLETGKRSKFHGKDIYVDSSGKIHELKNVASKGIRMGTGLGMGKPGRWSTIGRGRPKGKQDTYPRAKRGSRETLAVKRRQSKRFDFFANKPERSLTTYDRKKFKNCVKGFVNQCSEIGDLDIRNAAVKDLALLKTLTRDQMILLFGNPGTYDEISKLKKADLVKYFKAKAMVDPWSEADFSEYIISKINPPGRYLPDSILKKILAFVQRLNSKYYSLINGNPHLDAEILVFIKELIREGLLNSKKIPTENWRQVRRKSSTKRQKSPRK